MLLGQPYVNAMWCCLSHVTGVCKWDGDTDWKTNTKVRNNTEGPLLNKGDQLLYRSTSGTSKCGYLWDPKKVS